MKKTLRLVKRRLLKKHLHLDLTKSNLTVDLVEVEVDTKKEMPLLVIKLISLNLAKMVDPYLFLPSSL
jgi:hypothetical protein